MTEPLNNPENILPCTVGMLQLISKCLREGECPSLASHCDRASNEILELRAKVAFLENTSDRLTEYILRDIEDSNMEEEQRDNSLSLKDYQWNLPKASTVIPVKSTISWVEQLAYLNNLKGASV
jgi:hypothetical protein